jgi:uncharacterized protein (TIGR03435 family)
MGYKWTPFPQPVLFACHLLFCLAAATVASAQTPSFDAASVRPDKTGSGIMGGSCHGTDSIYSGVLGFSPPPLGRCVMRNVSLKMLIQTAYDLRGLDAGQRISGGPGWLDSTRYDVEAEAAEPVPEAELKRMLQSLLAERFQLALHRETREMPGYTLVIAKRGPKLKEAKADEERKGLWQLGGGPLTGQAASMQMLAQVLAGHLGRPISDGTGLTGAYDFTLTWTPDESEQGGLQSALANLPPEVAAQLSRNRDPNAPSLFTALQEQIGLRLEPQKKPVDVLVIDHAEQPSAN